MTDGEGIVTFRRKALSERVLLTGPHVNTFAKTSQKSRIGQHPRVVDSVSRASAWREASDDDRGAPFVGAHDARHQPGLAEDTDHALGLSFRRLDEQMTAGG